MHSFFNLSGIPIYHTILVNYEAWRIIKGGVTMAWQSFLILKNNVKEHNEKTNRIYLPRDTAGAGLFFIMSKKYVRCVRGKRNIVSVGYSSDFIFHLYEEKDGRTLQTN